VAVTLLVTATALEAAPLKGALPWSPLPFPLGELYELPAFDLYLAHLGVAKVNTAAGLALALSTLEPERVVQFGIGGAFAGSGLGLEQVAVATQETHLDTGVQLDGSWHDMAALGFPLLREHFNVFPTDPALTQTLAALTRATPCAFGTSETVTGSFAHAEVLYGRFGVAVESMEGAAAAQVCVALGVPFAELRGISNTVGERDKSRWAIHGAVQAVNQAVLSYLRAAHKVIGNVHKQQHGQE
jgi:futalosine hydrolase